MFSSRFHWDHQTNRLTRLLTDKRRAGEPVLDLTESNPTRAGLDYPREILQAFDDPRMLSYDPAPAGSIEARAAVSRYYAARGYSVDAERILLTASTSEAYAYLFKLLANPGDNVLVPRPSYPLFEFLAGSEAVEVLHYPLVYDGAWSIDMVALEAAVTDRTRAIVLVNPNNPTGSFLKRDELAGLQRLGLPLISDEVFSDYAFEADAARVSTLVDVRGSLAFSMSGLSKVAGLPQMKLGWIVCNDAATLEKLEWIADTYLSVSTPVQCAAGKLLAAGESVQRQIRERTAANLAYARTALVGSSLGILQVEGGWYITLRMPRTRTEEEWALDLLSRGVLVQPGFFYDFESEAFLVVSLLTPPAVFQEGIARILEIAP